MEQIRIDGKRVYLRSITYEDTDQIVKWRNKENVKKYFFYRGEFTAESHTKWLKERVETGEVVQFVVCDINDDRPIGCTYIRDIDHENKKAEYGTTIHESIEMYEINIKTMGLSEAFDVTVQTKELSYIQ